MGKESWSNSKGAYSCSNSLNSLHVHIMFLGSYQNLTESIEKSHADLSKLKVLECMALNKREGELFKRDFRKL